MTESADAETLAAKPSLPGELARRLRGIGARDPFLQGALVTFLLLKAAAMVGTSPSVYPDGKSYRVAGSWLDFSLTSLDGSSVRPWGATIWMALWPGDRGIQVAQAGLSFLAWSALALAVAASIQHPLVRRVTAGVLLLVPCTAQVASWDGVMQSDAVSVSSGVLTLAMALRFSQLPTWRRAAALVVPALWFAMTRPNVFVILLVWAAGMVVVGLLRREALLWGATAAALVVISVYSYAYNVRTDQAWDDAYGYSKSTVAYAYPVGAWNPVAPAVIRSLRESDAPRCMIPETPKDVAHGTTRWAAETSQACQGMNQWAKDNWNQWWARWLLSHPGAAWKIVNTELPNSLSPSVWGEVKAPVPGSVAQLLFGSMPLPQDPIRTTYYRNEPVLLWTAVALGLAVAGARSRRWRGSSWAVDAVLGLTVVGSVGAAVSSALLIQTVPFEVAQESLAAAVLLTASVLAAVGLGVDRLLSVRVGEATEATLPR